MSILGAATLLLNRLVKITIGGDLAVTTTNAAPTPSPPAPSDLELREGGGFELREDGGHELRELGN